MVVVAVFIRPIRKRVRWNLSILCNSLLRLTGPAITESVLIVDANIVHVRAPLGAIQMFTSLEPLTDAHPFALVAIPQCPGLDFHPALTTPP